MVVFARISAKKSELIDIEENRTKLFLETEMLWQSHDEPAERTLHGASAEGSIAGVADRTKNRVRVTCSRRALTCRAGNRCFPITSTLSYEGVSIIPV